MSKAANTRCETPCKERFLCEFQRHSLHAVPACGAVWELQSSLPARERGRIPERGIALGMLGSSRLSGTSKPLRKLELPDSDCPHTGAAGSSESAFVIPLLL